MTWCEAQLEEEEKQLQTSEDGGETGLVSDDAGEETREAETSRQPAEEEAASREGREEQGGEEGWGGQATGEVFAYKGRKLEISEMCGMVFPCEVPSCFAPLSEPLP